MSTELFEALTEISGKAWEAELALHQEFFERIGERLPPEFRVIQDRLRASCAFVDVGPISKGLGRGELALNYLTLKV